MANKSIILNIDELKRIVDIMQDNKKRNPDASDNAKFQLKFDSDWNANVIDTEHVAIQFSKYADANPMSFYMNFLND